MYGHLGIQRSKSCDVVGNPDSQKFRRSADMYLYIWLPFILSRGLTLVPFNHEGGGYLGTILLVVSLLLLS